MTTKTGYNIDKRPNGPIPQVKTKVADLSIEIALQYCSRSLPHEIIRNCICINNIILFTNIF